MLRIGKPRWAGASVSRVVDPLRAETLRTAFVESDAVFQIGSMPGRAVAGGSAIPQKTQHFTLKVWFADGVLRDQPGRFGAIFTRNVFSGPAVFCD